MICSCWERSCYCVQEVFWLIFYGGSSLAETKQRICFLNVSPDELIRSLFYNKNNESLITVSVYASDNFSSLKCRTTRIEFVHCPSLFLLSTFFEFLLLDLHLNRVFQIYQKGNAWCWICAFWVRITKIPWFCRVWRCKCQGSDIFRSG